MQRGDMIHVWLIRFSDGSMECSSGPYQQVLRIAKEHVKGTNLTYLIIE